MQEQRRQGQYFVATLESAARGYTGLNTHLVYLKPDARVFETLRNTAISGNFTAYTGTEQVCRAAQLCHRCVARRGRQLGPADSSPLLYAKHSPLRGFQTAVDATSGSSASALSNVVSTTTWKLHSDEWLACKSELHICKT